MAGLVQMMSAPVRIGVQNELQDLRLAVNVAQYDTLDLLLNVYEGSNVAIQIWTGMQVESDEGWVLLGSAFPTVTTAPGSKLATFTNPLAFIRWKMTNTGNTTFMITGIGRQT
jgi:hypothetical protein